MACPLLIRLNVYTVTQLARSFGRVVETGYAATSAELPSGGWAVGTLIELRSAIGIAELRLLRPALAAVDKKTDCAGTARPDAQLARVQFVQLPGGRPIEAPMVAHVEVSGRIMDR